MNSFQQLSLKSASILGGLEILTAVISFAKLKLPVTYASNIAKKIYDNFSQNISKFIKVMQIEYKRILDAKKMKEKELILE